MNPQPSDSARKEFDRAEQELGRGNVLAALACLEKGLAICDDPHWHSRFGFCIAKERGHLTRGLALCRAAIEHEPDNPLHYLYLGKTHLVAGDTLQALQVFRHGMARGGSPELEQLLLTLGSRKPPPLPFLSRDHPLNKYLGIALARLGLR